MLWALRRRGEGVHPRIELGAKNANISYNLACAHAMAGNPDAACHALDQAIELGFAQTQLLAHDSDLESLRALPRFQAILAKAKDMGGPCDRDENYRRFDFWIGEWSVEGAGGQEVGTNTIRRASEGCALHEHWVSASGVSGAVDHLLRPVHRAVEADLGRRKRRHHGVRGGRRGRARG